MITPLDIQIKLEEASKKEKLQTHKKALRKLFQEIFPHNNSLDEIHCKVSALNDMYSTRVYDTFTLAKHIYELKIDNRLTNKDISIVQAVAKCEFIKKEGKKEEKKTKILISFASKYCHYHQPDTYPIYDSYVVKMLAHYGIAKISQHDDRKYDTFYEAMGRLRNKFELTYTIDEIDTFLWLTGQDKYPRKKRGKKA